MFVYMKNIVCILTLLLFVQLQFLSAQEAKKQEAKKLRVAVFDPSSSGTTVDEGTKVAVRELISSTFVNTGKYTMVERSLLDKVMKEMAFSNTEVVDDSQATEIGKLAGANKVVLSVVTLVGGRNMLSVKTIDVQTATIDLQKTRVVSSDDLLEVVEPLTLEMLGEEGPAESSVSTPEKRGVFSMFTKSNDKSKKTETSSKSSKEKAKSSKEKTESSSKSNKEKAKSSEELEVIVEFAGMASNKNPEAKIFVDGKFAGEGTFNGGFLISFAEKKSGKHKVSIKWEDAKGVIDSEDYKIDTRKQRTFTFECIRGKKRYELKLK
jgi:hypothetical protein